jgi:hypothetical protein
MLIISIKFAKIFRELNNERTYRVQVLYDRRYFIGIPYRQLTMAPNCLDIFWPGVKGPLIWVEFYLRKDIAMTVPWTYRGYLHFGDTIIKSQLLDSCNDLHLLSKFVEKMLENVHEGTFYIYEKLNLKLLEPECSVQLRYVQRNG